MTVRGVANYRTVPPELLTLAAKMRIFILTVGWYFRREREGLSASSSLCTRASWETYPAAYIYTFRKPDQFPLFSFEWGLTYSRQLRSPRSRAIISASAVAMLVATGML